MKRRTRSLKARALQLLGAARSEPAELRASCCAKRACAAVAERGRMSAAQSTSEAALRQSLASRGAARLARREGLHLSEARLVESRAARSARPRYGNRAHPAGAAQQGIAPDVAEARGAACATASWQRAAAVRRAPLRRAAARRCRARAAGALPARRAASRPERGASGVDREIDSTRAPTAAAERRRAATRAAEQFCRVVALCAADSQRADRSRRARRASAACYIPPCDLAGACADADVLASGTAAPTPDEDSRVPRQGNPAPVRRAGAARHPALHRARSGRGRAEARRPGLGRQGADPRRRPRQGRRRQGRRVARRRQEARRRDPRHAAEDAPDRPRRPEGAPPADRRRRRHQEGVLRRRRDRPRDAEGRAHGLAAKAAWTSRKWRTPRPRRSSRSSSTRWPA